MNNRIVADIMCLLDVFRKIPGIPERGVSLETAFRTRYLYDQTDMPMQMVVDEIREEPKEEPAVATEDVSTEETVNSP
jgi:hypothetical protein